MKFKAIELFAGVGGFRVGLEASGGWDVIWSNQFEPTARTIQHASNIYVRNFGSTGHFCLDVEKVLDSKETSPPPHDLLVGGFPCQDYSVARPLNQAAGIVGKKGVLWWSIHRLMKTYRPRFVLLENVDRLLKSPAAQKGRDFAIMLRSMGELGYQVQWRVVNSADYGLPQKRRRVFIVGERVAEPSLDPARLIHDGVLARALPIKPTEAKFFGSEFSNLELDDSLYVLSSDFGTRSKSSPFENAGIMDNYKIYTKNVIPDYPGPWAKLGDVLQPEGTVDESFYIPEEQLEQWKRLKYKKDKERRIHRATGTPYTYSEGSIPFPDSIEGPSRTILTGEGGTSPSRFKHVVEASDGRYRRLTPEELETLNGFSKGWTEGVSPGQRAFLMGNALVVDIVKKIGKELKAAMETRP